MSVAAPTMEIRRVAGTIGAEIAGVRVGPDLAEETIREIRAALLQHKVIFFRGQHHLDDTAHAGFAQRFGELSAGIRAASGNSPESYVTEVNSSRARAEAWHTDYSSTLRPHALTMLRSVLLPPYGGDTAWANAAVAYQSLSPELRELADTLRVVHSRSQIAGKRLIAQVATGAAVDAQQPDEGPRRNVTQTEHPVVRVHPETGERSLLLGVFAKTIAGRDDSWELIQRLQRAVERMEHTVRWRWAPGDLAVWDNRSTQHRVIADFGSLQRTMRRVTTRGEIPVGADGRPSVAITTASGASA